MFLTLLRHGEFKKPVNAKINTLECAGNWHLTVVTTKPIFKKILDCTVLPTFLAVRREHQDKEHSAFVKWF